MIAPDVPTGTTKGTRFSSSLTCRSDAICSPALNVPLLFQSAQTLSLDCWLRLSSVTVTFAMPNRPATSGEKVTPSSSSIPEASSPVAVAFGCPSASTSIVVPSISGAVCAAAS